jgi:spermidine/putrescine-binding protein
MLITKHYSANTIEEAESIKNDLDKEYAIPQYMHDTKILYSTEIPTGKKFYTVELTYSSLD